MFVEHLLVTYNLKLETSSSKLQATGFKNDKYMLAEIAKLHATSFKFQDILLVKPQTFMNKSGDSVSVIIKRQVSSYKFQVTNDLIVVHDDLDIPFGKFKIQTQGPKAHNGITDIQNKLRTMDFLRIRIGIDNRTPGELITGEEYVLNDFSKEELDKKNQIFSEIITRFDIEKNSLL